MKKLAFFGSVILIIGLIGVIVTGNQGTSEGESAMTTKQKSLASDGIDSLELNVDVGTVHVTEIEGEDIEVHLQGNLDRLTFDMKQSGSTAKVVAKTKRQFFSFSLPFFNASGQDRQRVDVRIPKHVLTEMNVKTSVGALSLGTIHVKELSVTNEVGNIKLEEFVGERVKLRSAVGAIKVLAATGEIDIRTEAGKIDVGLAKLTHDVQLKSDVGTITVALDEVPDSLLLDIDSELGKVKVDGLGLEEVSRAPVRVQKGDGHPKLNIRTEVGAITVSH